MNRANALETLAKKITQAIRDTFSEPEPPPLSATALLRSSGMLEDEGYYIGCQAEVRNVVHLKRMYSYLLEHPRGGELIAKSFAGMILTMENLTPVFLIRAARLLEQSGWIWQGEPIDTTICIPLPNTEDRHSRAQFFFNIVGTALPLPDETEALKSEFAKYLETLDAPEPRQSQDSKQKRINTTVILLFAYLLVSTAFIPLLIVSGWQNVTMQRMFDREVILHLQKASNASTVEVAKKEISTAVNFIENNDRLNQRTNLYFPDWFQNLKTLQVNLEQVSTTAPMPDQAIALKNVQRVLLSHQDSSREAINVPEDFDHENAFYILFIAVLIIVVGTCLIKLEQEGYHLLSDLWQLLRHLRFPGVSPPSGNNRSN